MAIWCIRIAKWIIKATNTKFGIFNTYYSFMPKVVARTRPNVELHVHCLCCLFRVFIICSTTMFYFPLFLIRLMQLFLCLLFSFFALKFLIFLLCVHIYVGLIMFPHEHISIYHFTSLHSLTLYLYPSQLMVLLFYRILSLLQGFLI